MLILESRFSPSELAERWDDRTSPARFAGNDDVMDDIYIARRKDNRVFLIRKGVNSLLHALPVFLGINGDTGLSVERNGHYEG